jgi:hypothetical protein
MARDRQQRITLKRVDDEKRRFDIANARRLIFEKNYAVDSKVLNFLNAESWVPTLVSTMIFCHLQQPELGLIFIRMLFPTDFNPWDSTYLKCWSSIYCMSLSLVYGKPSLFTSYGSYYR